MRPRLPPILLAAILVAPGWPAPRAAGVDRPAALPPLTTVAEIRAHPGLAFNIGPALSLTGIVTLVDPTRNMLVLQDATGALALHPLPPGGSVQPGERVTLKGSACSPYILSLPGYPFHPSGRDIRGLFEAPHNEGSFCVTRMRGWLRPPVTGNYTFWIASDDSSELWLSTGRNPADARKVAFVPTSGWTDRREWSRFPAQRSESFFLRAEESYYIEALQEQRLEQSHLAVAWEGPGLKQAVIDGRFMVPWREEESGPPPDAPAGAPEGVLREFWTDFSVGNLALLKSGKAVEVGLAVQGLQISRLAAGDWPEPQAFDPGRRLSPEEAYRWVEGEGAVLFLATDGTSATLELAVGQSRVLVRVARWPGNLPPLHPRLRVKFRGVWEVVRDANENLKTGFISVPTEQQVAFFEEPAGRLPASAAPLRDPVAAGPGGYFFTRGVVTFHDVVRDQERLYIQDATNGIFVSQAERQLRPKLQVGQAVRIGGPLLLGKFSPGMRPTTIDIFGWQNLPNPARPSPEAPAASFRDGQWTEIEGVARAVNADGTVLLMGRQVPLLVWIGQAERGSLEKLVNATLRARGVMSLDTFDGAALLVPSRSFVEVVEPAPEVPATPVPIARLLPTGPESAWPHQVKVAGTVTYRNDRHFFLQDDSGGVRVEPREGPPATVGATVEVVGFPGMANSAARLTEAVWRPLEARPSATPASFERPEPEFGRPGLLVRIEARLLSQRTRGAAQILELQAGQHVFEAVLERADDPLRPFATGSLLALTGVCVLEAASSSLPPERPSVAWTRLLLRTPLDVTLLQGPPWWTWQRTVTAIGLLLAVLAGSLLRIAYLKRRFARQETARLAFARGMLESQETERRRIAASLHDSLGQNLLVIRSQAHLALQSGADKSALDRRLEEISNTTLQAIEDVREITHNLRPYQLDRLGLSHAIRALTRKVSESCAVIFAGHVDEIDELFDKESEIHIYRIVQEGLNNIVKHSGATEAAVVVKIAVPHLSISIRDNGRGLAAANGLSAGGFGLSGMQERAQILGGTTRIDSSPQHGVTLHVEIPLPKTSPCAPA